VLNRRVTTSHARGFRTVAVLLFLALLTTACAAVEGDDIGSPIFNGTLPDGTPIEPPITTLPIPEIDAIRVPFDHFSIQNAVNVAQPGDLILIDPGVYTEEVTITTPDIVLRGRDRNTVFVDGLHNATTGLTIRADGVAIENMTIRNFTRDAVQVGDVAAPVPLNRFRGLHLTTSNTGRDGISVTNATNVEIQNVWGSGHAGAGISITDCTDCNTLVETTLVEFSGRGMSVVDARNGVNIIRSTARNNRAGIVVEDGLGTTEGVVVAGSVVLSNGFSNTPLLDPTWDHAFGVGVHVGGTTNVSVLSNRIATNTRVGVLLGRNTTGSSGLPADSDVAGNTLEDNREGDVVTDAEWVGTASGTIPYQNGPLPPGIEGLPNPDSSVGVPAGPVVIPDLTAVVVPDA